MSQEQLKYLLALWLIPQCGPAMQKAILQQYPDLAEFFSLTQTNLKKIGIAEELIQQILHPNWKAVDATLEWGEQDGQHLLSLWDENYPETLRQIHSTPTILLAKGDLSLLQYSQIAIIGSRNPTQAGLHIAKQYAEFLASQGLVITSGLALGIDGMAHLGALNVRGKTTAVIGTGIDVIYPKRHRKLTEDIINKGLLLSEFPLGMQPQALNFPRRNRIISGLSLGTFVVEASIKSGSLITARFALEQGREVFAMPSSVHNPMAKGCHWLIKQGATLVESVEDIWQQIQRPSLKLIESHLVSNQIVTSIPLDLTPIKPHIKRQLTKLHQQLLDVIGFDRMGTEALSQQISLNVEQVSVLLLELELLGYIEAVPGGYQRTHERGS